MNGFSQKPLVPVGGAASGLFYQERHWKAFIQQPKLTCGRCFRGGVQINSAFEQVAVNVGDQRANVAGNKCGGAVEHITRSYLAQAALQKIRFHRGRAGHGLASINGENGPDGHIDVDVGGAIERIDGDHIHFRQTMALLHLDLPHCDRSRNFPEMPASDGWRCRHNPPGSARSGVG